MRPRRQRGGNQERGDSAAHRNPFARDDGPRSEEQESNYKTCGQATEMSGLIDVGDNCPHYCNEHDVSQRIGTQRFQDKRRDRATMHEQKCHKCPQHSANRAEAPTLARTGFAAILESAPPMPAAR